MACLIELTRMNPDHGDEDGVVVVNMDHVYEIHSVKEAEIFMTRLTMEGFDTYVKENFATILKKVKEI